ncbi:MAG: tRNA adenosine(34) deaminase TadA [Phycisphaeraceae bacterium]
MATIRTTELDHHYASETDLRMMQRAIELAYEAWDVKEVPVGAVVYRGEEVIAEAYNLRESDRDPTAHAEVLALRQASQVLSEWRLNDCSMAVTLEPCPMCAGAIINARLGRLVYGANDPKMGAVESLYELCDDTRFNHQPQIIRAVLAPECRGILRQFFKERRRENKLARQAARLNLAE